MRDVHVAALLEDRKVFSLSPVQGNLVNKVVILLLVTILIEFSLLLSMEDIFTAHQKSYILCSPPKTNWKIFDWIKFLIAPIFQMSMKEMEFVADFILESFIHEHEQLKLSGKEKHFNLDKVCMYNSLVISKVLVIFKSGVS